MIYRFERSARRTANLAILIVIWISVVVLTTWLDMAWYLAAAVLICTLPAFLDFLRNSTASVEVWPRRIVWASALRDGSHGDIDHVRLNRRYDGTMKITLVHVGGAQTRLPPDVSPPIDAFEAALKTADINVQRHPFSVLG